MKFQLFLASFFSQIKGHNWWLGVFLWFALLAPAQASVILRVAIERNVPQVNVGSSTNAVVKDGNGRTLGELPGMKAFAAKPIPGGVALDRWQSNLFWVEPGAGGFVFIGDRWYRGRTLVIPTDKGVTAVNWVDLEEYLYSVLGGEMNPSWPEEALKAQAIAARTYALYERQRQRNNPLFDLGDSPDKWQIYKGVISETKSTYGAVDSTKGQVLTYKNRIIASVFHACAGGQTENVNDVWGSNPAEYPYLRSVRDFDDNIKECYWQKSFTPSEISAIFPQIGNVKDMKIEATSATLPGLVNQIPAVTRLRIIGDKDQKVLTGEAVRTGLRLRSTRFTVSAAPNGSILLQGRGFGHGLGMSQWGAYNLARQNASHLQILGYYYPGAALTPIKVK